MPNVQAAVRSTTRRAQVATAAVAALCLVHVIRFVHLGTSPDLRGLLADVDWLMPNAPFDPLIWIASLGWFASIAIFFWWAVGAHRSAKLLGRKGRSSPSLGWVVFAYFVPMLNLFRPYQDMATLAWFSDPRDLPSPPVRELNPSAGYREAAVRDVSTPWSPPPSLIGVWWASYIALTVAGAFVRRVDPAGSEASILSTIHAAMVQDVLFVASGALCVAVIRGITACQRERARRLVATEQSTA